MRDLLFRDVTNDAGNSVQGSSKLLRLVTVLGPYFQKILGRT